MLAGVGVILAAYLLGSIPCGLIVGKLSKGIDVRQYGSGNIGATNAFRTLGFRHSLIVFVGDFAKGLVAVLLASFIIHSHSAEIMAGLAAIVGHNWSVFLRFSGGKGVSTSIGSLFAMAPPLAIGGAILFIIIVAATRYVSLGSVIGGIGAFLLLAVTTLTGLEPIEYLYFGVIALSLLIIQHRTNLLRLFSGTERRIDKQEKIDSKA